ncbi:MAG: hypothetical protein WC384_17875 [Prolixibacteraceae bacterium]|jgi:hypothetical protein
MIDSLNDFLIQPGVQKAMQSPLVIRNMDRFKIFLGAFYLKALNKWTKKLQKFLSLKTLILLNLIIISYYAGKVNAVTVSGWMDILSNVHVWFGPAIILNVIYLIGRFLRNILIISIRIAFVILILWAIYRLFQWIYKIFVGDSDKDLSPEEK